MNASILKFSNKLELRYSFNDKSNYMDALIKHRCEKEILYLIRAVADLLDVKLTIYNEPYEKGGFREIWGVAGENARSISVVLNIVMQILTRSSLLPGGGQPSVGRTEEDEEHMQRELAKLRQQLKLKPAGVFIPKELLELLNGMPRFCKNKSNFYEALRGYPKVVKVSVRELNEANNSRSGQLEVKRDQFDSFILRSDEMPAIKDNKAIIEIISPVLKDSRYRWKGIYNKGGETIDFYMCDEDFKKDMFNEKISFTSGMCIDCVLVIERRLSELGETINVSYTVQTVIRTRFDKMEVVTPQGKRYLRQLKAEKQQLTLDLFG
ncbi:MAG: hypothetical protein RR382_02670 [Tannerellaceae bacterium]